MNKGLDMLSYQRELMPTKKRVLMADFQFSRNDVMIDL